MPDPLSEPTPSPADALQEQLCSEISACLHLTEVAIFLHSHPHATPEDVVAHMQHPSLTDAIVAHAHDLISRVWGNRTASLPFTGPHWRLLVETVLRDSLSRLTGASHASSEEAK